METTMKIFCIAGTLNGAIIFIVRHSESVDFNFAVFERSVDPPAEHLSAQRSTVKYVVAEKG